MKTKKKITILGGGVAGCSAAYWLTHTPELREKYEVSLIQMGWRLGGKGASGRNRAEGFRSEEHGPHVWYGGYENALRMLRDCYQKHFENLGDHGPYSEMIGRDGKAAFLRSKEAGFIKEIGDKQHIWHWQFPDYEGTDGDGSAAPEGVELVLRVVDLIKLNVRAHAFLSQYYREQWQGAEGMESDDDGFDTLEKELTQEGSLVNWAALKTIATLQKINAGAFGKFGEKQDALKVIELADCFLACGHGYVEERMKEERSFEEMDDRDFQDFLRQHGAVRWSLEESAFARSYYDAAFAYPGGGEGSFGAGTALRGFLWIFFGYKGSYIYKMQGGMGEIVFTPIYQFLRKHVDFKFFQRVDELHLSADGKHIEAIDLTVQTDAENYDPLLDVPWSGTTMKCWPSEPLYAQLPPDAVPPEGDPGYESPWSKMTGEKKTLQLGEDFDEVILAIPVSALPAITSELVMASPRFAEMIKGLKTVRSIAAQLWLTGAKDEPALWGRKGFTEPVLSGGAAGEWDIWMDYSAILPSEDHGPEVRHLLYGCGVMPDDPGEDQTLDDPSYPASVREAKRADLEKWLDEDAAEIWPEFAVDGQTFDRKRLFAPAGKNQMAWQYCRTNIEGTERYTTPATGTIAHRLAPGESGFENLTLAGDWTKNGIDIGCVEAAATSGMLAAEHVTGEDFDVRLPQV